MIEIGDNIRDMKDWFELGIIIVGLAAGLFIGWLRI